MKTLAPALLFALTLAACGYTETHEVILRAPAGPTQHDVEIYMAGQPLARPFYEVALLQVVGHGTSADLEDLVKALTLRARALGCDAIAQIQFEQGYSMAHAFGVCVVYAQPSAATAPGAPPPSAPPPSPAPAPAPAPTVDPASPAGTPL